MLRHSGLKILIALALSITGFAQSPATNAPAREITSAKAALSLSRESAETRPPARIKGVVTCSDAATSLCFVQDKTAGIYVYMPMPFPSLGDAVEITGKIAEGRFSPVLFAEKINITGRAPLPIAQTVGIDQVASGRFDSQWLEVEGVIVQQGMHEDNLTLTLASGASRLEVRVLHVDRNKLPNEVDARVKIKGVGGTLYSRDGKLVGFHLLTQDPSLVTVLEPPPSDPFFAPLRSSRNLLAYSPQRGTEHRVRIKGVVTFFWAGHDFFVRDPAGGICVEAAPGEDLEPGDLVEVSGFPAPNQASPWLRNAVYHRQGASARPAPLRMTPGQVPGPGQECDLVSIEATVREAVEPHNDYSAVVLETSGKVFHAYFQNSWTLDPKNFQPGAIVDVTGISQLSGDAFSLWMRSPKDLRVIHPSPLERRRQWIMFSSLLGGGVLLPAVWILLLRMRVRRYTEAVRKREVAIEERYRDLFENSNDILYTHDLDGRITSMNNSGQVLFGYTDSELLRMNVFELVDPEDREMSMRKTQIKVEGTPRTTYELRVRTRLGLRLYLDVTSRAVHKDGVLVGIQGIARDITARKKAEEALRISERQLRASLEERERLGRDLHDGIIQSIYAAGLNLDDCSRLVKTDTDSVERRLRKVTSDLNRVIREVRDFIMGLERHRLRGEEFKAALKSLTLTIGEGHAARVDLNIDEKAAAELSPVQATQLLQIAREALSNMVRHAKAQKLIFQLNRNETGIVFEVIDDGIGFNPATRPQKGFGIRNMAVRAEEINADFQIFSQSGEGTRIVLDIRPQTPEEFVSENPITHRG